MALNLILSEKSYFFEYKSFEKTTRFITIGREDGLIIVMNTDSWKFHFSIRAHEGKVNDLKKIYFQKCAKQYNYFSSNDFEYLVSCGSDGTVKLWQIEETSKLHKTIDDSPVAVSCLATVKGTTQKHDKLLLTGAVDGVIRVYLADLEFQLIQKIVSKNQRSVLSLAVVNDEIKTVLAVEAEAGEGSEENGEPAVSSIILQQYVTGL
jgi:WD40 repeat protein